MTTLSDTTFDLRAAARAAWEEQQAELAARAEREARAAAERKQSRLAEFTAELHKLDILITPTALPHYLDADTALDFEYAHYRDWPALFRVCPDCRTLQEHGTIFKSLAELYPLLDERAGRCWDCEMKRADAQEHAAAVEVGAEREAAQISLEERLLGTLREFIRAESEGR